jgi:Tol biopolymer transport system component
MTSPQRFERDLPTLLEEIYMGRTPDYRDDLVGRIGRTRQRPAWTFPGRWLPMDLTTERVPITRVPWRAVGLVALLALLLAASLAVYIGSQQRSLPDPFGVAATGDVAYAAEGDIYTVDPVTGEATAVVSGPETDVGPRFSRDGTKLVFERKGDGGRNQLYVTGADGTDLTLLTPEPLTLTPSILGEPWEPYQFSPDGRTVVIASLDGAYSKISIAQADGSGIRTLDVGMPAYEPTFRPPDGAEILFIGLNQYGSAAGVFAVDLAGEHVRTIVEAQAGYDLAGAEWSPDGSRIAYWMWGGPDGDAGLTAHTHVVAADGTGDITLPEPPGAVWSAGSAWSNDGARLFGLRGYTSGYDDVRPVVIPADGSSTGVELPFGRTINGGCCAAFEWAPDDSKILATPADGAGSALPQVVIDPLTGDSHEVPWNATSDPAWQRIAP